MEKASGQVRATRVSVVVIVLLLFGTLGVASAASAAQSSTITFSATFVGAKTVPNSPYLFEYYSNATAAGWNTASSTQLPLSINRTGLQIYGFLTSAGSWSLGYQGSGQCPSSASPVVSSTPYDDQNVNASTPSSVIACYYEQPTTPPIQIGGNQTSTPPTTTPSTQPGTTNAQPTSNPPGAVETITIPWGDVVLGIIVSLVAIFVLRRRGHDIAGPAIKAELAVAGASWIILAIAVGFPSQAALPPYVSMFGIALPLLLFALIWTVVLTIFLDMLSGGFGLLRLFFIAAAVSVPAFLVGSFAAVGAGSSLFIDASVVTDIASMEVIPMSIFTVLGVRRYFSYRSFAAPAGTGSDLGKQSKQTEDEFASEFQEAEDEKKTEGDEKDAD